MHFLIDYVLRLIVITAQQKDYDVLNYDLI